MKVKQSVSILTTGQTNDITSVNMAVSKNNRCLNSYFTNSVDYADDHDKVVGDKRILSTTKI